MRAENERFACIKVFTHLNGRKRQSVIIGDSSDARTASFFFKTAVKHNWPSQWHSRYRKGFIEFENGKKFDLATESIDGESAYIFKDSPCVDVLFRKQVTSDTILRVFRAEPEGEWSAMADLMAEEAGSGSRVGPWASRWWVEEKLVAWLEALSVRQLQDLAELFTFTLPDNTATIPLKLTA